MRLVDVLNDVFLQVAGQIQADHRSVRQVEFIIELSCLLTQLLCITCHVTDDDRIEDGTKRTKNERGEEFEGAGTRDDFSHTKDVETGIEQNQILA